MLLLQQYRIINSLSQTDSASTMANWIAVPGNAIVSDFTHPLQVEYHPDGAIIKPNAGPVAFPAKGIFHAYIPSAPNGSSKVKKLQIKHAHILSKTVKVQIYHGNNMLYQGVPISPSTAVDINHQVCNIDAEPEHLGWGVSVTVEFAGPSSVLLVSSISLEFQ